MRYPATLLLLLLSLVGHTTSEEPLFVHYNVRDGLAGDQVTAIVQDELGFLWIGTRTGLSKFDGKDFVTYTTRTPNRQLTSDIITDLALDSKGRLWVLTTDGINIITKETGEVRHFRFPDSGSVYTDNWCLKAEPLGNRMIVTREKLGFVIFNIEDLTYDDYYLDAYGESFETPWGNILQGIHIETGADTVIWFSGKSLVRYDLGSQTYERIRMKGSNSSMRIQYKAPDGKFWLGSWGRGILRFDPETLEFEQFEPPFAEGQGLYEGINLQLLRRDSCSMWYTSHEREAGIFNHCTGQYIEFTQSPDWHYSLRAEYSETLYQDRSGRVWLGSAKGLTCVDPSLQRFSNLMGHGFDEISAVLGEWTFPVAGGRYFHSPQNREIYFRDQVSGEILTVDKPNDRMWCGGMFQYGNEILVYGSDGILRLDTTEHALKASRLQLPDPSIGRHIREVVRHPDGDLYAAVDGVGLFCLPQSGAQWERCGFDNTSLFNALHVWSDSMLMVATDITVFVRNLHSDETTALPELLNHPSVHDFDDVVTITEDLQGRLWFSSDRYPTRVLEKDFEWQYFADSVSIADFHFDQHGAGYLVSNQGFGVVDPEAMTLKLYGQEDGLNSQVLRNSWSSYIGPYEDGKIIFGMRHGWQIYNPEHRFEEKDFSLYIKDSLFDGRLEDGLIRLRHDYAQLGFHVGLISYSQRHKTRLKYRLNPDLEWVSLSDDGQINLPRLGAGSYQVEVMATNVSGQEQVLSPIRLEVLPPFWKTAWFFVLTGVLVVGVVVLTTLQRARRVQAKVELEKEVMESELKSLQAQMNPHFIFNSLNSIKSLIQEKEGEDAIQYLTTFSQLVRGILNASSQQLIPLEQDLEMMQKYIKLESLRFSDSFTFTLDNDLELESDELLVPPLLCQIYLENAIWHGLMQKDGERALSMRITEAGERMRICIEDNGIGRAAAAERQSKSALKEKSVGMNLAESRLDSLGRVLNTEIGVRVSDLTDQAGQASGTLVEIDLPKMDQFV